ncbi:MAG: heparinase II/III family protein [Lentisphaeria bacterium]|nr:heparinase II/III family protein [Lentisphaeria bacterium]
MPRIEKNGPPEAFHWAEARDEDFIASLRSGDPGLRRACACMDTDLSEARGLVLAYFRTRQGPRWLFDFRETEPEVFPTRNYFWGTAIDREQAAQVLRYRVRDPNCREGWHDLGPEVDWRRGLEHLYGSSGWLVLHFWYWGLFAAAGYAMTRDDSYARVFERFWHRWQEDFPFHLDPDRASYGGSFSADHSVMRTGRRILVLTDVVHSGLLSALDDDVAFEVLKYIWFASGHYLRLPRNRAGRYVYVSGNHNLFDSGTTPYCIGMAWPEFSHSSELVDLARPLIRRHVRSSIHREGVSVEHSTRYAWYIANMYVQAVEIARLNEDELLSAAQEQKLRRFLWTLVELSAPDGSLIPLGDCQPPPDSLQLHSYRALFDDAAVARRAEAFGVDLGNGHTPCAKVCADPPPGMIRRSMRHYRESGMVVVRDGVDKESSLLWIVADPRGKTGHGHFDFTSFQLWCRGRPIVFDTSGFGYRIEEIVPEERAHYYSPFGHSLLTIDEICPEPMERLGDVRGWWGSGVGDARIEEASAKGLRGRVVCSHRSYPGFTVRRVFDFDLAQRWVNVEDQVQVLAESADIPHAYRQIFHLGFGLAPQLAGSKAAVVMDGVKVEFLFGGSECSTLLDEHSVFAQRAATVFGLGTPRRLVAQCETAHREVRLSCRIQWELIQ